MLFFICFWWAGLEVGGGKLILSVSYIVHGGLVCKVAFEDV